TKSEPIPISEIGKSVQADVVIYATIDAFHLTPDGQTFQPGASFRVRVVDATNDKRLWPESKPYGEIVNVSVSPKTSDLPTSTASRFAAEDELARQAG